MNKNSFMWAQGNNANILEPIRELAEYGWQHRDIPKASNMNWIFKQIGEEFTAIRKDMIHHAGEIKNHLDDQASKLEAQEKALKELETLNKIQKEIIETLKADFLQSRASQDVFNKTQQQTTKNIKAELDQSKTVEQNLVRAASRALFTLNANNLNTKLHPAYPFNTLPELPSLCHHCGQHHTPEFDCRHEVP